MSSYLSNLLTNTTSRYNSLRRTLLSDEADGDTEDDSHISRVLRAYYTEKSRPFPPWLPPDPKNSQRAALQNSHAQHSSYGNLTGSMRGGSQTQTGGRGGGGGGLSDLWDPPAQQQAPPQQQPVSLRRTAQGRPAIPSQRPSQSAPQDLGSGNTLGAPRLLPSQRVGSYQSHVSQPQQQSTPSPPPSAGGGGGGGTAQERLKARLWGGKASPAPSPDLGGDGAGNPFGRAGVGSNAPWTSGRGG
ncbi:GTPase activating protein [Elasticomyces elasticus]|nr:GTPase activating protein [Elasticomyces elasticus]